MRQYIFEVRKLLPVGVCKKVLDLFDDNYEDAPVAGDQKGDELKEIRNCVHTDLFKNSNSLAKTILIKHLNFVILTAVNSYKEKYPYFIYDKVSELTLLKYENNKHKAGYVFHTDTSYKTPKRALSCSIALNNDYEGGEFQFDIEGQIYGYPQNIGDCIIFPSNFMFPHTVTKITKGTRNALISWIV